jgi:hypothetical protein
MVRCPEETGQHIPGFVRREAFGQVIGRVLTVMDRGESRIF